MQHGHYLIVHKCVAEDELSYGVGEALCVPLWCMEEGKWQRSISIVACVANSQIYV